MIIIFILRMAVRFSVFVKFYMQHYTQFFCGQFSVEMRIMSWRVAVTKGHKVSDLKENYSQSSGGQESQSRASAALTASRGLGESLVQAFLRAPSGSSGPWCPPLVHA